MAINSVDHLNGIALLQVLSQAEREKVWERCHVQRLNAGTVIIAHNDRDNDVVFIVEGTVRVCGLAENGREVTYAEIAQGGHVGELAAIDAGPRSANVVAATDCLLASLPAADFHDLLMRSAPLAFTLLRDFASVIRAADAQITELCTTDATERLCRILIRRARFCSETRSHTIDSLPTQQVLASVIGSTRETVAKTMAGLQHRGLIARRGRCLHLLDIETLAAMAHLSPDHTAA